MHKTDDITALTATAMREAILKKELSPVEVIKSSIARIEAVNPCLNAVITDNFTAARKAAIAAEKAIMDGDDVGILHGLPIGIKDLELTAGLRTTFGSKLFADNIPTHDQGSVAQIRREGGIIIGKTNTPEFGTGANTRNLLFGATGNPFDPEKTSGGSSGGSAAGLATGMMALATGSDYGGSLRTPASYCAVVGYRPSAGTIPSEDRAVSLSPFSVLGPMGRCVNDIALLTRAQMHLDQRDPFSTSLNQSLGQLPKPADLGTIRAAFSDDLDGAPMSKTYRHLFAEKLSALRASFGYACDHHPDFRDADNAFEVLRGINFIAAHGDKVANSADHLSPFVIDNVRRGLDFSAKDIAEAHLQQSRIARAWLALFDEFDIIISPACAVPPFDHQQWSIEEIDGVKMASYMSWLAITYRPTMAMACAIVLPCGVDGDGLPFGIQILGRPGADRQLLDMALAIEGALGADKKTARPLPDLARLVRARP